MLVLVPGEVVDTVHVSPVDDLREVFVGMNFPGIRASLNITTWDGGSLDTASTVRGKLVDGGIITRVGGLRELVDGVVVEWVVLLSFGGLMPDSLGPGVLGSGPGAVAFDTNVVGTSADAEETILTPVSAPGVSD